MVPGNGAPRTDGDNVAASRQRAQAINRNALQVAVRALLRQHKSHVYSMALYH